MSPLMKSSLSMAFRIFYFLAFIFTNTILTFTMSFYLWTIQLLSSSQRVRLIVTSLIFPMQSRFTAFDYTLLNIYKYERTL